MDWEQQDVIQESRSLDGPECQVKDLGFYTVDREKPFLCVWFVFVFFWHMI